MVELDVTTAWHLLATAIISSGVLVALIESFRDWLFKRREEYVELTKQKIDIISKATAYYNQIAFNCVQFSRELGKGIKERDVMLCMYHLCIILELKQKIRFLFGDIQLDNLEAEEIIDKFFGKIVYSVKNTFNSLEYSKFSYLTKDYIPYHLFYNNVQENEKALYGKFSEWISNKELTELTQYSQWYAELIMFELNHIYAVWYGDEPKFSKLSPKLRQYLLTEHQDYHNRLLSIETRTMLRRR